MSQKISDFFKIKPKESLNKGIEKALLVEKISEIRDCFVSVKDVNIQIGKKLQLFEGIALNKSQQSKTGTAGKHIKSICNEKNSKPKFLDIHMKKKHPESLKQQFECDFDGKIFKTRPVLYNHMVLHLPLVPCKICKKLLKTRSMDSHMIIHGTNRNFYCKICSKSFKSNNRLNNHAKTHNKKFECEICKKNFSGNGQLNFHNKHYHDNAEGFKCEICDKKFNQKFHLKSHQKIHDKNRPKLYKCQRCGYATDDIRSINKHQKFHERQDEKFATMKNPLKCEKCPTFHQNEKSLQTHMKIVHPNFLFQCDLCALLIKTKSNLITHINIHIQKLSK